MTRILLVVLAFSFVGCGTLRDPAVYSTEIQFTDLFVQRGAPSVHRFLTGSCSCAPEAVAWTATSDGVSNAECEAAADWYRTYGARWGWHVSMMRYNGNLDGATDPGAVPTIPHSCDLPAPGGSQ